MFQHQQNIAEDMMKNKRLFTPGPLNTSDNVRAAMNQDMGSRTEDMVKLTKNIRFLLEKISGCTKDYTSILMQGSGTFSVEAMITSLIPQKSSVLIVSNGVYGERMIQICDIYNIPYVVFRSNEKQSIDLNQIKNILENTHITHILTVQFETALGVLNDINGLLTLATQYQCAVLVDAMSAFGALPLNYEEPSLCAVAASSNKCLHGVPGIGFVIARMKQLLNQNFSRTLSLNLVEQWKIFEKNGEWRFTPPIQVLLAFHEALNVFEKEGGVSARLKKYSELNNKLISGFKKLNIYPVISEKYRAPMVTTFFLDESCFYKFEEIYQKLFDQDIVLYPSASLDKKNNNKCFRVGCMGEITLDDIDKLIEAMKKIINDGENNE